MINNAEQSMAVDFETKVSGKEMKNNNLPNLSGLVKLAEITQGARPQPKTTPASLFGLFIGTLRRQRDITTYQIFAEKTNVDPDTLSAIEIGSAPMEITAKAIPNLAKALGISSKVLTELFLHLLFQ